MEQIKVLSRGFEGTRFRERIEYYYSNMESNWRDQVCAGFNVQGNVKVDNIDGYMDAFNKFITSENVDIGLGKELMRQVLDLFIDKIGFSLLCITTPKMFEIACSSTRKISKEEILGVIFHELGFGIEINIWELISSYWFTRVVDRYEELYNVNIEDYIDYNKVIYAICELKKKDSYSDISDYLKEDFHVKFLSFHHVCRIDKLDQDTLKKYLYDVIFSNGDIGVAELIEFLYKDTTDKAHGIEHINAVMRNARAMKGSKLTVEEILAVIFHDIEAESDRDWHNVNGAVYFSKNIYELIKELDLNWKSIERAIWEHRAKYKGEFYSSVSELVSAADRGSPKSLDKIIERSYQYAIDKGSNHEEAMVHALEHIADKYSRTGYANFPNIYIHYYEKEMEKFYREIEELNIEKIQSIVEAK